MNGIQRKVSSCFPPLLVRIFLLSTTCGVLLLTYQYRMQNSLSENVSKDGQHIDPKPLMSARITEKPDIDDNNEVSDTSSYNSFKSKMNEHSTNKEYSSTQSPPDERVQKLPGVINIGIQKCGTGALNTYLRIHPQLRVREGEVHFFDKKINHSAPFKQEIQRYLKMLPVAFPNETVFEKTPAYFDLADPYDLFRMNSALKVILLVCDPVRRVMSAYLHNLAIRLYSQHKTYEQYVFDKDGAVDKTAEVVRRSIYDESLKRYLKYFPRNQLLIMENTFLLKQPTLAMQEIEKFIGLKKFYTNETFYFNEEIGYHCINPSIYPVHNGCQGKSKYKIHPNVSEENVLKLKKFFQPINDNFMKIAGIKMASLTYF
ncbi:unnamed protein product [Owenia fusiformis]|uniref:Sulfotransferase domain-containing protein n=1 Tax=Owenia fusiformis TaxID=6347 RepID=A0A8S4PDB4_OWEFU|nr:unnamed protein product [Owenia fusiformis]